MHDDSDGDEEDNLPVPAEDDLPAVRDVRDVALDRTEQGVGWAMNQLTRRVPIEEQLHETVTATVHECWSCAVKPPKHADDDVVPAGERLLRSLHGEIPRFSIEIHKTREDGIEFHFVTEEREDADRIRQLVLSEYPHAEAEVDRSRLPIREGDVCRVDRVEYDEDYLLPLLHNDSAIPPDRDPLGGLLDTMADTHEGRCAIQTVVEPLDQDWTTRWARGHPHRRDDPRWWRIPATRHSRIPAIEFLVPLTAMAAAGWWAVGQWFAGLASTTALYVGLGLLACVWWSALFGDFGAPYHMSADSAAESLRNHEWTEAKATREERRTADTIAAQSSDLGFRVSQRLLTMGRRESAVDTLRKRVGSQLRSGWKDPHSGQQLRLRPVRRVPEALERVAERRPTRQPLKHAIDKALTRPRRRTPSFMAPAELASVGCHLPDSSTVSKGGIDWAAPRLIAQVPPSAPRYQRPGWSDSNAVAINAPLARAGQLLVDRLPRPLADRLAERGIGIERQDDGVQVATVPEWVTSETHLDIDVDHRETAHHERYGTVELKLIKEDDPTTQEGGGDVWMGAFMREIVESKQQRPRDDILIGYQERGGQAREVAVDFDTLFTHIFIQGVTGGGKSTLAEAILAQWIHAGFGLAIPDPSGELVKDVLRWLPSFRHDDVVYYSPEPDTAQKIVGFNPFEISAEPDDQDYGGAVDDAVDRVENGLRAAEDGDQWGARMIGVCRNLSRVMIRSDEPFTLVDLHDALSSEEGREKLAERAGKGDEFVAKYTRKIAKFDDEELDSLLRRLNEWVESTVSRTTVAVRDSSLDLDEIVREGKILLFDNKLSNSPLSRMLGTYVWSHIWDICEDRPKDEREPFMVLADEFDDLITPEMNVGEQLRNARKYELCLVLMTQYLDAIGNKEVEHAIDEECATTITLPIKGEDASGIARRLGLDDEEYLTRLARFHALVEIEVDGDPRGPFEISLPAPVAPERTLAEAREDIVEPALDRYGREPLTDQEIHEEMLLSGDERERFTTTDDDGNVVEDDPLEMTDERQRAIVRAIHDETLVSDQTSEGVRLEEAAPRIRRYHDRGEELADLSLSTVLNQIPSGVIERREDEDGDLWVQVVDDTDIYDTGRSGSAGKWGHDQLLRDAYEPLTKAGLTVDIESQSGGQQTDAAGITDGSIVDGEDVTWSDLSRDDKRAMTKQIAEDHPHLATLLLGREAPLSDSQNEDNDTDIHALRKRDLAVSIEAEKSTGNTKGGYTARNVAKSVNSSKNERCLLLCRPDDASNVYRTLTDPPFVTSRAVPDGHEHRFYNLDNLTLWEEIMLRPERPDEGQDHTVWSRDGETDEIVLSDTSGAEHARFEDAEAVFGGAKGYPMTCPSEQIDDASDIPDGFKAVKKPFLPEWEFPDGVPDQNEWEIVTVPPDATDPDDLGVYRDGEKIPLGEVLDHEQEKQKQKQKVELMDDLLEKFDR